MSEEGDALRGWYQGASVVRHKLLDSFVGKVVLEIETFPGSVQVKFRRGKKGRSGEKTKAPCGN